MPDNKGIVFINHFEYTGIFGRALEKASRDFIAEGMQLENESLKAILEGEPLPERK